MEAHQGGFFCLLGEQGTELVYALVTPTLPEWHMSKEAVFTMKLEPELRDAFLRAKVDTARAQIAAGQVADSADVEARAATRRTAPAV